MARYGLKFQDGVDLYGKYVANWGGESTAWKFEGIKNGKVVSSVICRPSDLLHLDVKVSNTDLTEGITYDMAAVRVRILDENNNSAPYAQLPVKFSVSGAAELVGPSTATAEGGMCGTYIRTIGTKGTAELKIHTEQTEDVIIRFTVNTEERDWIEEKWN